MRATYMLFVLVALAGLSFSLTQFGPGTPNDCTIAPIVIGVPDYYQWNPAADGVPMLDTVGAVCITVATNDVVIDCDSGAGYGPNVIDGTPTAVAPGIWIQPGVNNVTIQNCVIQQFVPGLIYIDTGASNVTINNTILTWTNPLGVPIDNIACVGATGVTIDNSWVGSPGAHFGTQSGLGNGVAPATCDDVTILNSHFGDPSSYFTTGNTNYGVYLQGDNFRAENSFFMNNGLGGAIGDGIWLRGDNDYINGNVMAGNLERGIYMDDAVGSEISDNEVAGNGEVGIFVEDSLGPTVTGNEVYSNGAGANLEMGIYLYDSPAGTVSGNEVYDNDLQGIGIRTSDGTVVNGNEVYSNEGRGIWIYNSDGTTVDGNEIYDNEAQGFYCSNNADSGAFDNNNVDNNGLGAGAASVYFDNCDGWTLDPDTITNGAGYGLRINNCVGLAITDLSIYGQANQDYMRIDGSTVDFTNLWVGFDEDYGVMFPTVTGVTDGRLYDSNTFIQQEFVSIDSTGPNFAPEFDTTAQVTTLTDSCYGLDYYYLAGFPVTFADITDNGTEFTPAWTKCIANRLASYQVENFTGYAVLATGSGGDDDGKKTMSISVSDCYVGEECTITVKSGGSKVENADIMVTYWLDGMLKSWDLGGTNTAGEVTFTPEYSGEHEATARKSGYNREEKRFEVEAGAAPPPPPEPECESDSDCPVGQECIDGECEMVEELPPEEEHEPECLIDTDCDEGFACVDSQCLETALGEELQSDADSAIAAAQAEIDAAKAAGKDTTEAEAYLAAAQAAYDAGDYETAKQQAEDAEAAAKAAPTPAAPAPPPEQPEEVQVGEGAAPPAAAPPQEEFPWLWVLLILVLGGIVVWYLFFRGK